MEEDRQLLYDRGGKDRDERHEGPPPRVSIGWEIDPISPPLQWNPTEASDECAGDISP